MLLRGVCGETYALFWHTSASKAYEIVRPIFYKRETQNENEVEVLRGFTPVRCKFTLSQTAGEEVPPIQIPKWDMVLAKSKLGLRQVEFDSTNGNLQGFSAVAWSSRYHGLPSTAGRPISTSEVTLFWVIRCLAAMKSMYTTVARWKLKPRSWPCFV